MTNKEFTKINPEEVICIELISKNGNPYILVVTKNKCGAYALDDGFSIHLCNEFLRSLKVVPEEYIQFNNYSGYGQLIRWCNHILHQRAVENIDDEPPKGLKGCIQQLFHRKGAVI